MLTRHRRRKRHPKLMARILFFIYPQGNKNNAFLQEVLFYVLCYDDCMATQKKRLRIKDKAIKQVIQAREQKIERRNFLELIRRAARTAL
jgi:hypothetical protein